ncbi:MAG: PTS IIA-like nitrogen regulatory protein PtsN [Beijerinckiaceae bacterium]
MPITDLLTRDGVIPSLKAAGKKQLLEAISERAGPLAGLQPRMVFDCLLQRERLGSTGIGNGIAIPHGKFEGLTRLVGLFARLDKPIDFEALDGMPVDLVFVLLAPEGAGADHLKGLAKVARILRNPGIVSKVRTLREADVIFDILTGSIETPQAA